jgi:2-iminoacetate synthase
MSLKDLNITDWLKNRIKTNEIIKYLSEGKDFIDDELITDIIARIRAPDKAELGAILQKSLSITTLTLEETAKLMAVADPDSIQRLKDTAAQIKRKVYDNRIVTFAPLYLGNLCVNDCLYCGFRCENVQAQRRMLNSDEVKKEIEVLAGRIGHKRLIVVYGEHPKTDVDYMVDTIRDIYNVKVPTKKGIGQIRRVNVNAAPLEISALKKLHEVGIGTYQVFQETYHRPTYNKVHPKNTLKGDYQWRLYCMHRAMEAGIDDVGLGVLFGLYDWRFELLALISHAHELEQKFGVGPHTVSFPRLEPAANTPFNQNSQFKVSDEDFKKIVLVLRLAIPHTGMILTARETATIRREVIPYGVTQIDASTRIGIGAYSDRYTEQEGQRQQFILGDTRSLDEVIGELAQAGYITSFCTAGYRCGRTGECIMELLKSGQEGKFCKLNAILTFREWLDDFASETTKAKGEAIIEKELAEVKAAIPEIYPNLMDYYARVKSGQRDLYF